MVGEFKSEKNIDAFTKALRKQFWESTLEGEMDDDLGYEFCMRSKLRKQLGCIGSQQ